MAKNGKISIVGVGPGSSDYVTPIARKTVQIAEIVIGAARAVELLASDTKGKTIKLTAENLNDSLEDAIKFYQEGKIVAILSTGDPGFSGLLTTFSKLARRKNINFEVVPSVSSVQICAARLLIPWDKVRMFSFHEGASINEKEELFEAARKGITSVLLPDPKNFSPPMIARYLIGKGISADVTAFVCENLTLTNERIVRSNLAEVAKDSFNSLCVMVVKP